MNLHVLACNLKRAIQVFAVVTGGTARNGAGRHQRATVQNDADPAIDVSPAIAAGDAAGVRQ
jgi:hypothetical protein